MKKVAALLLTIMSMAMIPSAMAQSTSFPDVYEGMSFDEAIQYLKDNGIIEGYPDGTYGPKNEINRAEFTKIIVGALTDDPQGANCFPDVNDEWFAKYVCEAKNRGLVEGHPDGNFKPADNVNFSEASKIIAEAFDLQVNVDAGESEFWFEEYVEGLEHENAIPFSVEYFDEKLTRDEMAEMIWRMHAGKKEEGTRTFHEIVGDDMVSGFTCDQIYDRYTYYVENARGLGGGAEGGGFPVMMMDSTSGAMEEDAMEAPAQPAADGESTNQSSDDFSETNVQVEGVDEADIVKNDGQYIYLIKGSTVRIVRAYPADQMEEIISFSFDDGEEDFYPNEMYLDGDKMIVIGSAYVPYITPLAEEESDIAELSILPSDQSRVRTYIVDISNRTSPKVERTVDFEGNYDTSRKVGDTMYLIANKWNFVPYWYHDYENMLPPSEIIPVMEDSAVGKVEKIAPCGDIHFFPKTDTLQYIIAAAIPLADMDKPVGRSLVVGNAGNVYSSKNNMYVTGNNWGMFWPGDNASADTSIFRFALGDASIDYKAHGTVEGYTLDQFSMDEYNNHLRVATTESTYINNEWSTQNHLFVLNQMMDVVGKVENLAPGESIFSARFAGPRGYLVTFEQVDPLFVFNLSDPNNPRLEGELKIPGFSDYLHPYDANHLMGFGKEVDVEVGEEIDQGDFIAWEQMQGMKLSMFDVTDINNPEEMFTEVIGDRGTSSELLYNHKALLFDKEKDLLAFPVQVVEYRDENMCGEDTYSSCSEDCRAICVPSECTVQNGVRICTTDCDGPDSCVPHDLGIEEHTFSGAYVYDVDLENGFTFKGGITHLSEEDQLDLTETGYWDWEKNVQRILYIGENLYTVSRAAVKANDLQTLEEKNMVELAPEPGSEIYGTEPAFPF